jgi:hypothetical protein
VGPKVSVFVSYRRADTPYAAGRLGDRLGERFELFMDIDIAPELHFGQALTNAVSSCDVMLVLIGPSWLDALDGDGRRRLENPRDRVVQQIEAALARAVTVIPVLIDGARMPPPERLPEQLESLAFRQAISLRHKSFNTDITTLMNAIEQAVPTTEESGTARDRNVEQRLLNAWRQLRGEEAVATAPSPTAPARAGSSVGPELPITGQATRVLLILIGVSYLTLVVWSLPLSRPQDLEDTVVPLVLTLTVTVGFLPMMWWGARHYADRRHLWRSSALYAGVAVPVGLVLAVVTKYVSSVNPLFWLLLYAVAMIPGGLAYAMVRPRHARGAPCGQPPWPIWSRSPRCCSARSGWPDHRIDRSTPVSEPPGRVRSRPDGGGRVGLCAGNGDRAVGHRDQCRATAPHPLVRADGQRWLQQGAQVEAEMRRSLGRCGGQEISGPVRAGQHQHAVQAGIPGTCDVCVQPVTDEDWAGRTETGDCVVE